MKKSLAVLTSLLCASAAPAELPEEDFQLVGLNPVISNTAFPAINVLYQWEGRIYMGYGDVNASPGPIVVTSFDPAEKNFVAEFSAGTDLIKLFREIGDKLFIPSGDGVFYAGFCDYTVLTGRSEGYHRSPVGMFHMWDAGSLDGTDIWAVGSPTGIHRDSGSERSWAGLSQDSFSPSWCFPMNGLMHMKGRSFRPDGTWEPNSLNRIMFEAELLTTTSGEVVVARSKGVGFATAANESNLLSYDGQELRTHMIVRDFAIDGETVYALKPDGYILYAKDIRAVPNGWRSTRLRELPGNAWTIAVHENVIYAGTESGELWAARLDHATPDSYDTVGFLDELPDRFGSSLALSPNRLLVGAPHQGGLHVQEGRAYLYKRKGKAWICEREFLPSAPAQQSEFFGSAVALSEHYLAIVADGYTDNGQQRGEHARIHVYQKTLSAWEEFSWSPLEMAFAQSVAVSDQGWLAIGADSKLLRTRSEFSIYALEPEERVIQTFLLESESTFRPLPRVLFDGQSLILAQRGDPSRSDGTGQARVYQFDGTQFSNPSSVLSLTTADWFADSLDHRESILAVGAAADDFMGKHSGALHLYNREDSYDHSSRVTLHSPAPRPFARFGSSVALGNDVLVVGARDDECAGKPTGAAYLFRRSESGPWKFDYQIAPSPAMNSGFGSTCVIEGSTAVIGAKLSRRGNGATAELEARLRVIDLRPCPLKSWGSSFGMTDLETLSGSDADGDSLGSLLEFAFHLDPTVQDRHQVQPGVGVSGLPSFTRLPDDTLRIEFVRRRNGGLSYELQSHADGATWLPEVGWSESVARIEADWDRVNLSKKIGPAATKLFRFLITYTQPDG